MIPDPQHAPLFGCGAPGQICFSRTERRLLRIVRAHDDQGCDREALRRHDRELALHLCRERRNCLHWLAIHSTDAVLEVGAGAGALTGGLADRAASVTAVEASQALAFVNAVRQRNRPNVEIHGDPCDAALVRLGGRAFDLVILADVLHGSARHTEPAADPAVKLLSRLRGLLKPGGRIVLIQTLGSGPARRPGNGAPEPWISRDNLRQLAQQTGLDTGLFYYPFPDWRFASRLYSDDRPPRQDEPGHGRVSGGAVLVELHPQGQASTAAKSDQIIFSQIATRRRPEYRICTDIVRQPDGRQYVVKRAAGPEARAHVARLPDHGRQLATILASTPLRVNRCTPSAAGMRFDFLEGPSLAGECLARLRTGDEAAFLGQMQRFVDTVRALAVQPFRATPEFRQIFGAVRLPEGLMSADVSNIDLVLPNIIVHGGAWHVIDYEWTFDFPIPIDFVVFRTLRYLLAKNHGQWIALHPGLRRRLLSMAGIGTDARPYIRMELALQRQIAEPGPGIADLFPECGHVGHLSSSLAGLCNRLPRSWFEGLVRIKQLWTGAP